VPDANFQLYIRRKITNGLWKAQDLSLPRGGSGGSCIGIDDPNVESEMLSKAVHVARRVLTDRAYFWPLAALVVAGDFVLTELIIRYVSCDCKFF
jgi:hypothetical protein